MAEPVYLKTTEGEEVKICSRYMGANWPIVIKDPVKTLKELQAFPYQDGDVLVSTYPRTGTNWTMDLLYMLRNGSLNIRDTMAPPIEIFPGVSLEQPAPRFFYTHLTYQLLPDEHKKNGGKIILVVRNPKDTVVSLYHFGIGTQLMPVDVSFEEFLDLFKAGRTGASDYVWFYSEWDKALKENPAMPVLLVQYEDLKQDGLTELRRICQFLKIDRSDDFLRKVIVNTEIQKIKAAKDTSPAMQHAINLISVRQQPNTKPPPAFYRKGIVGDWKNHFTVAQSADYDHHFTEKLGHTIFTYEKYH